MNVRSIGRSERVVLPVVAALGLLLSWDLAVRLTGATIFPSPAAVVAAFGELLRRGLFWSYLRDSLMRVGAGYLLAVLLGVPVGMMLGFSQNLARAMNPLIQIFRPISPLAWMPLAVIWFGVSDLAPIFLIFLASFFPIIVSTANSVQNISPIYRQVGRNFGLSDFETFRRVLLPAILPRVLTGLRLALGIAWLVLVAAEMIAVDSGLGYLIIDARNAGKRYDLVVGGMILIGVTGLILDVLVRRLERLPSVRWGFLRQ